MKELKKIARSKKKSIYLLSTTSFFLGIVTVIQAYLIVSIVDLVFLKGASVQDVLLLLVALFIAFVARALFSYFHSQIGVKLGAEAKMDFRKTLFSHYIKNPIQASIKGKSGNRVSVIMDSVDEIDPYFSSYYPKIIQTSIVPFVILLAVFWQNWISGLILLVTAPLIPIAMIVIGRATQKKAEIQMEKLAAFSGIFLDRLQGLVTLRLFGKGKDEHTTIKKSSLDYRDATMDVLKIAFLSSLMLELISMLGIAFVAIEVGLRLVVYQELTFFIAFFVLVLTPEFFTSLKELGSAFHAGRGSMGAAKKVLDELESSTVPIKWGNHPLMLNGKPPSLELRNVSFTYEEGDFSIKAMNVAIEPFQETAIVGQSGSGKTTLLHLLVGLYQPTKGKIMVNNQALFHYKEEDWFQQLIYISQDPYLFSGTIKDNILLGSDKKETQEDELNFVVEKAGLSTLINELDLGYETVIGEGGRGLSGGEKQRIALARAFLKKPSVILFDEPTVGLDLQTERILQQSISELGNSSTIITVAHRLHTIKRASQILFMEKGELIANGTHEELMTSSEKYRAMFVAQQGGEAG
ncbi:thiol reductant ABC exporter subunit CydD [Alkalihalobacterium alkalinitrilicum]|uniref:thiol reductant ABC exporter subunit CydD n=1 Tax=Alkalihalobacterium alkalinitrilicum TaxID=427920 RepID=UPI000994A088|nr:thiol reductant ABC exporter subunit CydD [Alkalihalobacterium alkalinitrilicum]